MLDNFKHMSDPAPIKDIVIKWGLIAGGIFTVTTMVSNLTGASGNTSAMGGCGIGLLTMALYYGIYHFALTEYRDQKNGGFMTIGQGVLISVGISTISGLISSIFNYIYTNFIDPDFNQRMLDTMVETYEKMGMSEAQIDQSMSIVKMMTNPSVSIIIGIVASLVVGVIVGLIASAVLQKNPEIS